MVPLRKKRSQIPLYKEVSPLRLVPPKKKRVRIATYTEERALKLVRKRTSSVKVAWAPNPGAQVFFMSCPFREVLFEGTRGCGKTDSLIVDFLQHVGKGYGPAWRGLLFRETFPQLKDVIAKSIKIIKPIFPTATYNKSDHVWTFPDGEQLFLSYMKSETDYWNYHGHEYPWIGWEELCNWPDNSCYEIMRSCNRSSVPGMPRRYVSNTNPYGVGHGWVKQYFVDPGPQLSPIYNKQGEIRMRVTGHWWECTQLVENDPEYLKVLMSISDPNLRKAWLEGSWDIVAGGAIVDVWNPSIHVIEPFEVPSAWRIDRSFDWGSSAPFSVGWWAESDGSDVDMWGKRRSFPKGTLFRIAEMYGWNGKPNEGVRLLSSEIARRIKNAQARWDYHVQPGPADSSIFDVEDGRSIADEMVLAANIQWTDTADKRPGSRIQGLEKLRQMLSAGLQRPMEDPGIFIFNTCNHWLRTVPTLPRDEKNMDDVDTKAEDHAYDETRYRIRQKRKGTRQIDLSGV